MRRYPYGTASSGMYFFDCCRCSCVYNSQINRNLIKECDCMKKETILKVLLVIALILTVLSLVLHNDMTLTIATILMAVCVVISFAKKK